MGRMNCRNGGTILCVFMMILFLIIALFFLVKKEKGAKYISGFCMLTEEEQNRYDVSYMTKNMRNQSFIWSMIFMMGAILSYGMGSYFAILAFVIWLVLFLKECHLDSEKAFEKYLKKKS